MPIPDEVMHKVKGLEPHKGWKVGDPVRLKGTILRFVPEHDLALVSIDGPTGQAAMYVPIENLHRPDDHG